MKKTLLNAAAMMFISLASFAQVPAHRECGTIQHHEYLKQTRPNYENELNQYNQMIDQYLANQALNSAVSKSSAMPIVTIPVVVHVVYNTAAENISDAQAASQVQVLNDDFAKLNADANKVTQPTFSTVAAGSNIRFCLAQRDPNGNPTTGIIHKSTTVTSFGTNDAVKANASGGDAPWDVTKYVNIWICDLSGTLLGYGEFPTGTISQTWGLVIDYAYTGSGGSAQAPFNLGRTGTHEFGHCFNLYHIWGDDNGACSGSDQCADTPNQADASGGAFPVGSIQTDACATTSPGYMWMNYMDYTDDGSMYMFTANQVARMEAVINNAPWNVLQSSNACLPPTALDASVSNILVPANASSTCNNNVTPRVTIANTGSVTLTSLRVQYRMDATATQTLNWSGTLATGASTVLTLNAYTGLSAAAHTFSVWSSIPNGSTDQNTTNDSKSSTFTITTAPVGQALPFTERFDAVTFPPTGWVKLTANTTNTVNTWTRLANTTGIPVVPTTTACAKMDNFSGTIDVTGQLDALRTPALNLSGANSSLRVVFDRSYRMYSAASADSLNIYISTDCGGSWTRLFTKGGTQLSTVAGNLTTAYTPTANTQWVRDSVSLSPYVGQSSVYLKFESRSGWGNNLYLDNINVKFTPAAAPPVASFTTAATRCVGTPILFSDASTNSPTSWTWTFPGSATPTSTLQNPSVTYTAAGTYTITHTAANASGTSTAVSSTITVSANPNVAVSSISVCPGNPGILSATGATTYSWNTGATTPSISVTPTITTNYTVVGTNAAGCVNTKTVSVTLNSIPTVAASNATICTGASANLSATGAITYTWNTGATTSSISVTPTITSNYTVIGTNAAGCTNTRTVSVTVNNLPNTAVSSSTICSGSTGTLVASGASTYTWNTGATTANIAVSPTVNTNYTVTGTSAAGCVKTTTASVTVGSAPSIAANSTSVCAGSAATLNATGVTTYTWNTGATTSSISVSPVSTTVYTVSGNLTGCASVATKTVSVNVVSNPTVTVSNATICAGASANLSASGATSYAWNTGATTASITVTPTTTTNYTVTGLNAAGCSNSKVVNVSVNALPNVAASSATICLGGSTNLIASGASSYTWNTGATGSSLNVSPTSNTTYTVVGTSAAGCVKTTTALVNVTSAPSISVNSATICSGSTATLSANGVTTYTWSTSSNATSVNVNPTATTIYTVSGNLTGCPAIATQTAIVNVNALPNVTLGSVTGPLCVNNAAVSLSGSPAGGIYSGVGVSGSNFDPAVSGAGSFTISYYYTDINSCSATATQTVDVSLCTGINEVNDVSISVFPNPTRELIHVKMDASVVDHATIQLYDAIGKLVISETVNNTVTTLNLANYAKGMYTIRVVSEEKQSIIKVIKE
jgi:PKD repeat protein